MYKLVGIIDFENVRPHVSIPVFGRKNSNALFIPRTGNHFVVMDFYEVEEVGFQLLFPAEGSGDVCIDIGDFVSLPMVEDGLVTIIDPSVSELQFADLYPRLSIDAKSIFLSLKARLAKAAVESDQTVVQAKEFFTLEPVHSAYWVSKFAAATKSLEATENNTSELRLSAKELQRMWLDKFTRKSGVKMVESVLNKPAIEMSNQEKAMFHIVRFSSVIEKKKLSMSNSELRFQEKSIRME